MLSTVSFGHDQNEVASHVDLGDVTYLMLASHSR